MKKLKNWNQHLEVVLYYPLKLTYPLRLDGWKMIHFLLKWFLFRAMLVSGRVLNEILLIQKSGTSLWSMSSRSFFLHHMDVSLNGGTPKKPQNDQF